MTTLMLATIASPLVENPHSPQINPDFSHSYQFISKKVRFLQLSNQLTIPSPPFYSNHIFLWLLFIMYIYMIINHLTLNLPQYLEYIVLIIGLFTTKIT